MLAAACHAELPAGAKRPPLPAASVPADERWTSEIVKVPQRKHVRRTVNGLDTSGPRYSPYPPSQAAVKAGLLAIVRRPAKGVVKDFDGSRTRPLPDAMMNPPSAPYPAPSTLGHPAGLARPPALPHLHGLAPLPQGIPPALQPPPPHPAGHLLQPPPPPPPQPGLHGGRKMADADAPPNVTVSTSTIPLSMAAALQHSQPPDLTRIVRQISQFCQARAGSGATSVCEGQIANPSPIGRSLLIAASSRVSARHAPAPPPACAAHPGEHAGAPPGVPLGGLGRAPASYQSDLKQLGAWNQHQLAHLQQLCGEAPVGPPGPMGKPPVRELPRQAFAGKAPGYALELCGGPPFGAKPPLEKPPPSPPANGLPGPAHYANGHYFQPLWSTLLPTPNSDSSGSQDLGAPFHGAGGLPPAGAALECAAGPLQRAGPGGPLQTAEYLGGAFQHSCLREPGGGGALGKAPLRPGLPRGAEPSDSRGLHIQHPGYR
ncbi:protein FAM222B isoform X2 [Varanus komodoensis]|uniref:protein FAM222B isoform X2 n=1 Tax=Varanus komodoensis TaxID=61221 RepID=UPI001CF790E2|nr:protein FAM222B isoform X2 [Varanus komodoensis]